MKSRRQKPNPQASNNRAPRGIALVAVLWAVMLLALMAQSFTSDVRTGTQLTQNLVANAEARALADAAVHMTISRLMRERRDANRAYDGTPYRTNVGDVAVDIAVQDESGKIDINAARPALLEKPLLWAELTPDEARAIVDAIADWRDRDSLRRLNGAEDSDYRQADLGYEPKNNVFYSVDELRLVLGITPALYDKIRPALTVYSRQRGFEPRVATPEVLVSVIGDEARAKEFLNERRDGAAALDIPKNFIAPSPRTTFTIRATAKTANGAAFTREAVIRLDARRERPFRILAWQRGASATP